ncbi:hypothetical protein GJU40_15175 [Bacillus lacus]|uniref:Intracellular proteinase inhibitor BsuPI domain-containing protein n=1 Tax=Metabacillus lacus TaxID=1983721 RepID=A0A7X2J1D5_9BACI|nr:BsuPI-related putative proteinase inhibitor [Metabacillus lacus]MRX73484.1 hypothetical protein [Metabacillus lacus]
MKIRMFSIIFVLCLMAGCSQSQEAEEVGNDVTENTVQLSVDAREDSEQVRFAIDLLNQTEEEVTFEFRSGMRYEIRVLNEDGKEVYRYSKGRMFTQAIEYVTLGPGESETYVETWNYQDEGSRVPEGNYKVFVTFTGEAAGLDVLTAEEDFTIPPLHSSFRNVRVFQHDQHLEVTGDVNSSGNEFHYSIEDGHNEVVEKSSEAVPKKGEWASFSLQIPGNFSEHNRQLMLLLFNEEEKPFHMTF